MDTKKPLIAVAGTVGVGKTTLVNALADTLGWTPVYEQPEKNPYLERFYQDFKKWAFHLQIHFLSQRFQQNLFTQSHHKGMIQDRTIYEDRSIFTKIHYEAGNITEDEYHTYSQLFNSIVGNPSFRQPDLLVYLTGPFEEILKRVKKRGRTAEADTPESYWKQLYQRYESWMGCFDDCPVLRIDITDYNLTDNPDSIKYILTKISDKL